LLAACNKEGQSYVKVIRGNTAEVLGVDLSVTATKKQFDWMRVFKGWSKEHLASEPQRRLLLGIILGIIGQFKESTALLENISSETLTEWQTVIKSFTLSNLYVILNDRNRAILNLSEMANFDQEIDGLSLKGVAYYNLARINTDMAQYMQAEMYLNSAMKIFKRVSDIVRIGDCLHERGRILIQTGNSDEGIKSIESSIHISTAIGDMIGVAIGYIETTRALYNQGKLGEAEGYARKAISVFTLNGNLVGLGGAYHALGYILAMREDFAGAAVEFRQAIVYERSAGDKLDLAHSLHSLGDMYGNMQDFDKAQECLEESLKIKREIKDTDGIANSELLLKGISTMKAQGLV
jgi:tetratricopeptide (TPR) repeat protein